MIATLSQLIRKRFLGRNFLPIVIKLNETALKREHPVIIFRVLSFLFIEERRRKHFICFESLLLAVVEIVLPHLG